MIAKKIRAGVIRGCIINKNKKIQIIKNNSLQINITGKKNLFTTIDTSSKIFLTIIELSIDVILMYDLLR
jgi:hypothetical protein